MIGVFINPGRRPDQPEPTPQNWGDRDTNRPDRVQLARRQVRARDRRRADAGALQGLQHLEGSRAARHRRRQLRRDRRVHRRLGAARPVPQGPQHRRQLHQPPRRPRLPRHRARRARRSRFASFCRTAATTIAASAASGKYDETRDWFFQNVRLMKALTEEGLRRQLHLGHRQARPEAGRRDPAGHDALALARPRRLHGPRRYGRALLQGAGR